MARVDDLGDALLACSSVSAAIGLVLDLVLGLNLGLGQLRTLCTQACSRFNFQ